MSDQESVTHGARPNDQVDAELQVRIRVEFAEMPGLKLTLPQASRLFHVETAQCERALDRLVAAGALSIDEGSFVRGSRRRVF
jgi:hypothetical protein